MQSLGDLARDIDAASDSEDQEALCRLSDLCEEELHSTEGSDRILLLYYRSNALSSIVGIKAKDPQYEWSWHQPETVKSIHLLRRAIAEPSFMEIDNVRSCQIRTNLANHLHSIGRPVAANEQRLLVLRNVPQFAKVLAGRGRNLTAYARLVYDPGHSSLLLAAARSQLDASLQKSALWESGDRDSYESELVNERNEIADELQRRCFDEKFDIDQWSLGRSRKERDFRKWCLHERLFLNPLNDAYTTSVAATDVLHLPDHVYKVGELAIFPAYFNLLKQEYVSARYRLYKAMFVREPAFVMREVLLLDSGEGQALGHRTEDLKACYRSAYAIFDKVAHFLNDYFKLGIHPRSVSFRNVWFEGADRQSRVIRSEFAESRNWLLRGMYYLSQDLFDCEFEEVAEPDALALSQLRNQMEHRFLSFKHLVTEQSTGTHQFISIEDFETKSVRLLKLAREVLLYLCLAMHQEETRRREKNSADHVLGIPLAPLQIRSFARN